MEAPFINAKELNNYIIEKAKEEGFTLTDDIVEIVLDLEMEFLESKGLVSEAE